MVTAWSGGGRHTGRTWSLKDTGADSRSSEMSLVYVASTYLGGLKKNMGHVLYLAYGTISLYNNLKYSSKFYSLFQSLRQNDLSLVGYLLHQWETTLPWISHSLLKHRSTSVPNVKTT